jgi:hypothetical protein
MSLASVPMRIWQQFPNSRITAHAQISNLVVLGLQDGGILVFKLQDELIPLHYCIGQAEIATLVCYKYDTLLLLSISQSEWSVLDLADGRCLQTRRGGLYSLMRTAQVIVCYFRFHLSCLSVTVTPSLLPYCIP